MHARTLHTRMHALTHTNARFHSFKEEDDEFGAGCNLLCEEWEKVLTAPANSIWPVSFVRGAEVLWTLQCSVLYNKIESGIRSAGRSQALLHEVIVILHFTVISRVQYQILLSCIVL